MLKINLNLTINNLKACIGYEEQREVMLVVDGEVIDGPLLIKDVLYDNALVMIKDKEETGDVSK